MLNEFLRFAATSVIAYFKHFSGFLFEDTRAIVMTGLSAMIVGAAIIAAKKIFKR